MAGTLVGISVTCGTTSYSLQSEALQCIISERIAYRKRGCDGNRTADSHDRPPRERGLAFLTIAVR